MVKCSLAVDIGASSGRMIAGYIEDEKLKLTEVHRFNNQMKKKNDYLYWDTKKLFTETKEGILKCKELGFIPESIGIDTWAVDFVLLDEDDEPLTDAVAYRDSRTDGMMEEVFKVIDNEQLYFKTGIQFQKFNTIYQLFSLKKKKPEVLEQAKSFLMIPDYLNFMLSGKKVNEYTNASTTQLLNAFTKKWDTDLMDKLDINQNMFMDIMLPKSYIGNLREELVSEFGFDLKVILPATHDTASAVISVPEPEDTIYISSGTWSLIGVENSFPINSTKAMNYNFTNEGGIDYRYRFLKNIMGLWMIQEVKRIYGDQYSFEKLAELAKLEHNFHSIVNVNADRFLKPDNMILEIQNYCEETNQVIPRTPGQIAKCIFDSLANSYQEAINEIEEVNERRFEKINIIGGGSKNEVLNQLIADKTEKKVIAGPVEATAIGNIVSQLIALGQITDLKEARQIIITSFELKQY